MRSVRVQVWYVDGGYASFDAGVWSSQRADGVDHIRVTIGSLSATLSGHSAYWCYPEGDTFVFGSASFGYSSTPPEIVATEEGFESRPIDYVPDLQQRRVKLGWWRPGEEVPPR